MVVTLNKLWWIMGALTITGMTPRAPPVWKILIDVKECRIIYTHFPPLHGRQHYRFFAPRGSILPLLHARVYQAVTLNKLWWIMGASIITDMTPRAPLVWKILIDVRINPFAPRRSILLLPHARVYQAVTLNNVTLFRPVVLIMGALTIISRA